METETAIIVNGILMIVFSLGFLSYTVWLGFKVVRLSGELTQLVHEVNEHVDALERTIDSGNDEVWRNFDKSDSRLDRRITDELREVWNEFEVHNNRFVEIESVLNNTNKD